MPKVVVITNALTEILSATQYWKRQLLDVFKHYQTDEYLPRVLELSRAVTEITKLEVYVLEKLQQYTQVELQLDQDQIDADLKKVRLRLRNFVEAYTDQLQKDQFANSKSLSEYDN